MYVTLEEAKRIVWKRWRDPALRQEVKDYVGEVPEFLRHEPRAVLARHLATPNFDFFRFAEAAQEVGLKPICAEYTGDKFCTRNPDKLLLGKMVFFHGKGRNRGDRTTVHRVIDINGSEWKPFTEIRTQWGEAFIDFHHRLLAAELPAIETSDCTEWLEKMGGRPALFWPRHIALFVCHGILFDNFHNEGHEAEFTRRTIQPAIKKIEKHFGLKPLIVPLVPLENEREPYWSWYPGHLEQGVKHRMARSDRQARLPRKHAG